MGIRAHAAGQQAQLGMAWTEAGAVCERVKIELIAEFVLGIFANDVAHEHMMQLLHGSYAAFTAHISAVHAVQPLIRYRHDLVEEALAVSIAAGRRTHVVAVVDDLLARFYRREAVAGQDVALRFEVLINLPQVELHLHGIAVPEGRDDAADGIFHEHSVGIEKQHEFAACRPPPGIVGCTLSSILLEDGSNAVAVRRDDLSRVVGRTIVNDDYFQGVIGLLERAVDGGRNEPCIVEVDDYNRR
jgi:hypothetical protein